MHDIVLMQIFQSGRYTYKLSKRLVQRKSGSRLSTYETQAIVIRMGPDKLHDVPVLHPFRYDRKTWRLQQNTEKWQDVLMSEPLPSNGLLDKQLGVSCERSLGVFRIWPLTLRTFPRSAVVVTLRVFITTGRRLRVAL